jgi:hypothetical protein
MAQHPPANNGVQLPSTAVKDGGNANNDKASITGNVKRSFETKNGNTREDR